MEVVKLALLAARKVDLDGNSFGIEVKLGASVRGIQTYLLQIYKTANLIRFPISNITDVVCIN